MSRRKESQTIRNYITIKIYKENAKILNNAIDTFIVGNEKQLMDLIENHYNTENAQKLIKTIFSIKAQILIEMRKKNIDKDLI